MTRRSFTLKFKRRVIDEQIRENLPNNEVCRRYNIQLQNLKRWKEVLDHARYQPKYKKSVHTGKNSIYFEYENTIKEYINNMREQKFVVTVRSVINKLNELCPASVEKSFKSKSMWVYRFMSRHGFTHRRVTRSIGISDEELFRRKNNFYSKVESRLGRIPETIFINIDQTCLLYGSVGSSTIDVIGARAVQVQSRGNPLDRVTVHLAIASNGEKLPPFMIAKGTGYGRVMREMTSQSGPFPKDLVYAASENAWMTEGLMIDWIDRVLIPFVFNNNYGNFCLVMDSFQVHLKPSISQKLDEIGIETIIIPGGLTPDLQPLDIGVNSPFKHWLKNHYIFKQGFEQLTASQKRLEIARGVSYAWERINVQTIINSFDRMLATTLDDLELADEIE